MRYYADMKKEKKKQKKKKKKKAANLRRLTSMHVRYLTSIPPTPLQNAKQSAIGRAHRVDADDPRPERRAAVLRSRRACGRLFPKAQVARRDAAKEREDAGDDVWHGARCAFVPLARTTPARRGVFVFEQIRKPISASP
jgi:hypothetical protein